MNPAPLTAVETWLAMAFIFHTKKVSFGNVGLKLRPNHSQFLMLATQTDLSQLNF